jgi:hypothetical protein
MVLLKLFLIHYTLHIFHVKTKTDFHFQIEGSSSIKLEMLWVISPQTLHTFDCTMAQCIRYDDR